jgi:hypothetical protein
MNPTCPESLNLAFAIGAGIGAVAVVTVGLLAASVCEWRAAAAESRRWDSELERSKNRRDQP